MNYFLASLILTFGLQAVAAETGDFRFSRPIQWPDSGQQELLEVPLDSRVYSATRDGFPDLRLIDQSGTETPYLLQKAAETKTESRRLDVASETDSLKKQGKAIEIQLTLDKKADRADGLTVVTRLTDFEHRLQVLGSMDGKSWTELVRDADIFDYSSYMSVSRRDVALPANPFRKFKVVIREATQTRESELLEMSRKFRQYNEIERDEKVTLQRVPLKIDRIEFWRTETETLPESERVFDYPAARFVVSEDAEKQMTLIDIETDREPLIGFRLQSPTAHFNREAEVQIPFTRGIEKGWRTIGRGPIEALHFRDINRDSTEIQFPEQRQTGYRIIVYNRDNPPLPISAVTGFGPGYRLLFLPEDGKTYRLRYGSEKAESHVYESGPIRELLRRGFGANPAVLGDETAEKTGPEAFEWAGFLNSKWFLGSVVTLMVLVLGWTLVRISKGIERFPSD